MRRLKHAASRLRRRLTFAGVPSAAPRIRRTLPHDPEAFTQGLCYREGLLYESTGLVGRSSLRCVDAFTGNLIRAVTVPNDHAEGIAALGSTMYQLSWTTGIARLYDLPDLTRAGEIRYDGEGWGLSASPEGLLMTDGTGTIRIRDAGLRTLREIPVHSNGQAVARLNDLAWTPSALYANVWQSSDILEIDPADGRVRTRIDCRELIRIAGAVSEEAVLNGVAWNADDGTFFVSGKLWPLTFVVEMPGSEPGRP